MGKFQNVNFIKYVVLKVAYDYNNKTIILYLFKILRSSTRASALKIENFILEATFWVDLQSDMVFFLVEN
jgi:hypothetical protein